MDGLEKRLKDDAARIEATASPELRKRIDASLAAEREARVVRGERAATYGSLWLLSSLTGLAALLVIVVMMNIDRPATVEPAEQFADVPDVSTANPDVWSLPSGLQLDVETAELTSPLEEEFLNLQADFEKARRNVERDVRDSF